MCQTNIFLPLLFKFRIFLSGLSLLCNSSGYEFILKGFSIVKEPSPDNIFMISLFLKPYITK